MPAIKRARVFKSGNSQAVRLKKAFRFRSSSVEIFRRGSEVVLRESPATLESAFDLLSGMSEDFFSAGRADRFPLEKHAKLKR
ncbi:MAG: antitoxin [Betaproteobacteria bacterium]